VWYGRFQQYLQRKKPKPGAARVNEMKEAEIALRRYTLKTLQETSQLKKLNPIAGDDG